MVNFEYRALNDRAALVEGSLAADSLPAAREELRGRGLLIQSISGQSDSRRLGRLPLQRGRHNAKLVEAVRELSTLLSASIPLLDALDSLVLQQQGRFKQSLEQVREQVAAGSSLAGALREQPHVFDELTVQMVEVGENSGTLDVVLDQLAGFSERYNQLKDRVLNALFYPLIVFGLSIGVGVFLMTVVVPMLLDNLLEAGKSIPWPTQVLKAMSDVLREHGLLLALAGAVVTASSVALLQTGWGKTRWHRLLLRLPLLGGMARKQEIARMSLIVGTLTQSGIVLLEALAIAARSAKNTVMRRAMDDSREQIQSGRDIGEALESNGEFPPTVVQIFAVGQQTGKLEEMLTRLADNYDRQVASMSMRMATLLEPVLIVGLSVFVGFILFATVLPILEAGNVL